MKYTKIYIFEIWKNSGIVIGGLLFFIISIIIEIFRQFNSIIIGLCGLCLSIPWAGFKAREYYYKKAISDLSETEINILNDLKYGEDSTITVSNNNKEELTAIKYLAEKKLITPYNNTYRHKQNHQTKSHIYTLTLTTAGKEYKEKKNI